MNRIQKAYELQFRLLLRRLGARQEEQGLVWLRHQARRLGLRRQIPFLKALALVYERAARNHRSSLSGSPPARFFCDAGLGGLARWLRAAGYEAAWEAGIDDADLLRRARERHAIVLTTDSLMMERRVLRDGLIPSFWVPPTLGIQEQLQMVFREFNLKLEAPRCMACGGTLRQEDKANLRDRIPPRTYRWLNEFFVCEACGGLYWHGTHWTRIRSELARLVPDETAAEGT